MKVTIRKPTQREKEIAAKWPIWEKETSTFPWEYDEPEACLILEGNAQVTNETGEKFSFGAGDYVLFPKGMKCAWKITKNIKKNYKFG
jgi:uncharacterized cupin superfamily protein